MTALVNYKQKLGGLFRSRRVELGLTQIQVAQKMNYSTSQFISNFERGVTLLPMVKIIECAKLLDIPNDKVERLLLFDYRQRIRLAIHTITKKDNAS